MAFTLKGILHRKEQLNVRNTESGSFSTQNIVIKIRRFDSMTGEEMKANFVVLEASTPALVYQLGTMQSGTPVECSFFPVGAEYRAKLPGRRSTSPATASRPSRPCSRGHSRPLRPIRPRHLSRSPTPPTTPACRTTCVLDTYPHPPRLTSRPYRQMIYRLYNH